VLDLDCLAVAAFDDEDKVRSVQSPLCGDSIAIVGSRRALRELHSCLSKSATGDNDDPRSKNKEPRFR
jgi:hypothetical protein